MSDGIQNVTCTNRWYFDIDRKYGREYELSFGRVKIFLYENLYRSISEHNLKECFQLLKLAPKETSLDPYLLFRFIMILIESNRTESVNKNVIIYLESLLSKLDLCKPDIFVEFLGYFIRHNRIDDAKELFSLRHRYISSKIHREPPFVATNLSCYEFLLNYLDWNHRLSTHNVKSNCDVSTQGWIVNALESLKSTVGNYEYFVICLVRVLLYYGLEKKTYLFVSEFQRNNCDNISAQLLHYYILLLLSPLEDGDQCDFNEANALEQNRISQLEKINNFSSDMKDEIFVSKDYPIKADRISIMKNLRRLDSSRQEIQDISFMQDNLIDSFKTLMDGLENLSIIKNVSHWLNLKKIIEGILESGDEVLITDACFVWQVRYRIFWQSIDFESLMGESAGLDKGIPKDVLELLTNNMNRRLE